MVELHGLGGVVVSQTHNHYNLITLPNADQEHQLQHSKEVLNALWLNVNTSVYPGRNYNDKTIKIARKYCHSACTTGSAKMTNTPPIETFHVKRMTIRSNFDAVYNNPILYETNTYEYYKYWVKKAFVDGGWLVFMSHSEKVLFDAKQQQYMSDFITYIKSINVQILNYSDTINLVGNVIDMRMYLKNGLGVQDNSKEHFVLGANSEYHNNLIISEVVELTGVDVCSNSSLPSDFAN